MFNSINIRQEIADKLKTAFNNVGGYQPLVYCVTLPTSKEGNDELEKEAKSRADNGVIYIGRGPIAFNDEIGGIYTCMHLFNILIFSNDKNSDKLINNLFDITFDTLHTEYKIYNIQPPLDIIGYKSGLMMAYLQIYKEPYIIGN
jgi:hypothetical protein